jgi:hypothetical protein
MSVSKDWRLVSCRTRPRILRNVAVLSVIYGTVCNSAAAAPSAKPAASAAAPPPSVTAAKANKPDTASAAKPAAKVVDKPDAAEPTAAKVADKPGATKPAEAPVKPRPKVPSKPVARLTAPAKVAPSADDLAALRSEMKTLREDLNRAIGAPEPVANPEREQLANQRAEEQKKLDAIEAAVAGGLDRSAVTDSITRSQTRIAELDARLAELPPAEPPAPRSLYQVSSEVERLNEVAAQPVTAPAAAVVAASTPPKPLIDAQPPQGGDLMEKMGLLPLEFTAFGDFFYRFERPLGDDFHVGAVELDASLKLTPYVAVSTAAVYDGAEEDFMMGAFVIDCGIAGDGEGYVLQSKHLTQSGVSFGRFDVPFGIAYLEYPSVENRLVTQPQAVQLTHGGWNDLGAQGYAVGEHWTAVGYVVNGPAHPVAADRSQPSRTAAGARLSGKVDDLIEVGGSGALDFAAEGPVMAFVGGDVAATLGPLDIRGEYLLKHVKAPGVAELTHGLYGQAFLKLDPAFFVARYDTVLEDAQTLDRRVAGGAGVEIFPQGEVRAVYEQSLDSDIRMLTVQLVGGSSFQPTGLRR